MAEFAGGSDRQAHLLDLLFERRGQFNMSGPNHESPEDRQREDRRRLKVDLWDGDVFAWLRDDRELQREIREDQRLKAEIDKLKAEADGQNLPAFIADLKADLKSPQKKLPDVQEANLIDAASDLLKKFRIDNVTIVDVTDNNEILERHIVSEDGNCERGKSYKENDEDRICKSWVVYSIDQNGLETDPSGNRIRKAK
jgi:hypothetical protein